MVITGEVIETGFYDDIEGFVTLKTAVQFIRVRGLTEKQAAEEATALLGKQVKIIIEEDLDTRYPQWHETV